jgi:hypothetical protein
MAAKMVLIKNNPSFPHRFLLGFSSGALDICLDFLLFFRVPIESLFIQQP